MISELLVATKREELNMSMVDIEAFDMDANPSRLRKRLAKPFRYKLDRFHNGSVLVIGEIPNEFDLTLRDYKYLAWLDGMYVKKGERFIVFINLVAGDFPFDNLGE